MSPKGEPSSLQDPSGVKPDGDRGPETQEEDLSFEQMLERLEAVATNLENPDTDLETSLRLYEEGARLARLCHERLKDAELRVTEFRAGNDPDSTEQN